MKLTFEYELVNFQLITARIDLQKVLFLVKSVIFTHRRSVAKRGGCFQRRLFVCLFVCPHDHFQTIKRRMMKLGG